MKRWLQNFFKRPPAQVDASSAHPASPLEAIDLAQLQRTANQKRVEHDYSGAILLYQRALAWDRGYWPAWLGMGLVYFSTAQWGLAQKSFAEVEDLHPGFADAPYFLGLIAIEQRNPAAASAHLLKSVKADPTFKPALTALAPLCGSEEELINLEKLLATATSLKPDDIDLRALHGIALRSLRRHDEALVEFDRVLAARPGQIEILLNRAEIWSELGRRREADADCDAALELGADRLEVRRTLAWVFLNLDLPERAHEEAQAAFAIGPVSADLHHLLAKIAWFHGDAAAASSHWQRALAIDPDHVASKMGIADQLFYRDDYAHGWLAYEARFELASGDLYSNGEAREKLAKTNRWQGNADPKGTLYLWGEQGFGDQIMMIPWVGEATRRFQGRVMLYVPKPLQRLMQQIIPAEDQLDSRDMIPVGALNCPVLSLPAALNDLQTPQPRSAFLKVPEEVAGKFASRAAALQGLKVGLVWAGAARYAEDRRRSITLASLAPLTQVAGISFVSVQKGADRAAFQDFPAPVADWTEDICDFADSAALMSELDLLISVDSAPVHLAGALGVPVWVLSRHAGEWRWGWARNGRNHWYQCANLYSQPTRDDWASVIERVTQDLRMLVESDKR
jgi:tetratricopeptide (TPR) repeat protein